MSDRKDLIQQIAAVYSSDGARSLLDTTVGRWSVCLRGQVLDLQLRYKRSQRFSMIRLALIPAHVSISEWIDFEMQQMEREVGL